MSPVSVIEILYFFSAEYPKEMKLSDGGGLKHEAENTEVLELAIATAMNMINIGEIKDGKTIIMLLQYVKLKGLM